ncbi:MAG TPA: xanthine dehydrogenase family protein molybdopterin-binding subunit [Micropepsaceae bacterium]|nr:xanthine dehydrogenase family protein molybdopterin-binding subunit [Micropepsaceae bacterium]
MTALIGSRYRRLEDKRLLTGQGRYIDDIRIPGMLHAAFLRSPHPHAAIVSMDKSPAERLPGVHAVLSLSDLEPVLAKKRMVRQPGQGGQPREQMWPYALANGETAFVGEAVALVIAESRYIAEDATAKIEVEYEPLAVVSDVRAAAAPAAPVARRELKSNIVNTLKVGYGDADAAFRTAAHVIRKDFFIHRGSAHSLEARGCVAEYVPATDGLTFWSSTQKAHDLCQNLSTFLRVDETAMRVIAPDIGGGFGPKLCVYPEDVAVAAAAKLLKRPLKWVEDRREYFVAAVQERDQFWNVEIALDGGRRILGIRGRLLHDLGAYALQDVNLPYNSASALTGSYIVPALAMDVTVAYTNKAPTSSVRGAGYPQATFVIERLLDLAARELKLDPAELRLRNLIPAEKMPYEIPLKARSGTAIVFDSGDYPKTQTDLLKRAGWHEFRLRQREARERGRYIGMGFAHGLKGTGRGPFEMALVRVSGNGRVSILTGASAMGQGFATAMAQICAGELGLKPEDVTVVAGDSAVVPAGLGGFASRQTVMAGSSVLQAAREVAQKSKDLAGMLMQLPASELELQDGSVRAKSDPSRAIQLGELARLLRGGPGYGFPPGFTPGLEATAAFRQDHMAYANVCHAAEVEVDIETGGVEILRYVALHDHGVQINPMIVDGQTRGSIAHGIGNALYEHMVYDESAQPVTTTFADYLLPGASEIPAIESFYSSSPSPVNPLGVKGAGEAGVIAAPATVISAIENALEPFAIKITEAPLLPYRLRAMIASAQREA